MGDEWINVDGRGRGGRLRTWRLLVMEPGWTAKLFMPVEDSFAFRATVKRMLAVFAWA